MSGARRSDDPTARSFLTTDAPSAPSEAPSAESGATAVVVDGAPTSREAVVELLTSVGLPVAASVGDGSTASAAVVQHRPQFVFVAIEAPQALGMEVVRTIRAAYPAAEVLVYSDAVDATLLREAVQAGVRDVLPSPLTAEVVIEAVEQVLQTRAVAVAAPVVEVATGTVLTVIGGKGGIGKSTIATNLGVAIQGRSDHSVLLIDLDTRFGDIAILMDLESEVTLADLAVRASSLDEEMFRSALAAHESGIQVLTAPKHPKEWQLVEPERLEIVIAMAARLFDFVILDTPGALTQIVSVAMERADRILLVTSLDMTSIKDTAYMFEVLQADGFTAEQLMLVSNDVNNNRALTTNDVERVLMRNVDAQIPYDPRVVRAGQAGVPVVLENPKGDASLAFMALADTLLGRVETAPKRRRGLLSRVPGLRLLSRSSPA